MKLNTVEKNEVWLSRIKLAQNVQSNDYEIDKILNLLERELDLSGTSINNRKQELLQLGLQLANVMERDDYIMLTASLQPLPTKWKSNFSICHTCIDDIKDQLTSESYSNLEFREDDDPDDCDCKWFCGAFADCAIPSCDNTNSKPCCKETDLGCGFLFLGSCTGQDGYGCECDGSC